MKKWFVLISVLAPGLTLAACGSAATVAEIDNEIAPAVTQDAAVPQVEGTRDPGEFAGELPEATLLIMGTFMLEETEFAVDAAQAAELLPLWQVYKSMLDSDITAAEEIDALTGQISETMTAEQMQAIEAMEITGADIRTLSDSLGLTASFGGGGVNADGTVPEGELPGEGVPGSGGGPGSGMGGGPGGGQGLSGTGLSTEEIQSLQATREASGGGNGFGGGMGSNVSTELIDALIDLLQSK